MGKHTDHHDTAEIRMQVEELIQRHGPRLAGSQSCLDAARDLKEKFEGVCDRSWLDAFTMNPDSFWFLPLVIVGTFTLSGVLQFLHLPAIWSFLVLMGGLIFGLVQFIFLGGFFDPLFIRKRGQNVVGILEPRGAVRQQLVLCAHHDSALRCRFLERHQILYPFRMIPAMLLYLLTFLVSILQILPLPRLQTLLSDLMVPLYICGAFFILPFSIFYRWEGTPGAGDNLLASVLLIRIADKIRQHGGLERTRLILVSHDGEEVGMRGARAFLKQHRDLLESVPTDVLCIDSLHRFEDLTLLASDRNGTVGLSDQYNRLLSRIWRKQGYEVRTRKLPLGGGGTDAAVFADAGFQTASLIGISTDFIRQGLVYHTDQDDVAHLDDRIIDAGLDMLIETVLFMDSGEGGSGVDIVG